MVHRLTADTKGVFAISATPFDEDGLLDLSSTETLVDFYIGCGVDGITILGMMGEAHKLLAEESVEMVDIVVRRAAGRVPIVVGVSNSGVGSLVSLAHRAMAAGAAGVMVAPIPGLRTEEHVVGYFRTVCAALGPDVPVVLQDFPLGVGVHLSVPTVTNIALEMPQVVVFKHEDWPGLAKLSRLRQVCSEEGGPRLSILVGNGGLFLPQELKRGADGAMTGFAYPEMLVEVCRRFWAGDEEGAEDLFDAYLPLIRHETQPGVGLAVRKEILRRRGAMASAHVRAPGPKLDTLDHDELDALIARLHRRLEILEHDGSHGKGSARKSATQGRPRSGALPLG